jgi:hypothetical protein
MENNRAFRGNPADCVRWLKSWGFDYIGHDAWFRLGWEAIITTERQLDGVTQHIVSVYPGTRKLGA